MSSFTKPHVPLRSNLPTETSYIPTAQLYFQFLELNHNLKRVEGFKLEKMDTLSLCKFRKISKISYKFGLYQILAQFDEKNTDMVKFTNRNVVNTCPTLLSQFLEPKHNLESFKCGYQQRLAWKSAEKWLILSTKI